MRDILMGLFINFVCYYVGHGPWSVVVVYFGRSSIPYLEYVCLLCVCQRGLEMLPCFFFVSVFPLCAPTHKSHWIILDLDGKHRHSRNWNQSIQSWVWDANRIFEFVLVHLFLMLYIVNIRSDWYMFIVHTGTACRFTRLIPDRIHQATMADSYSAHSILK